jgi:hypothetical protein
MALMASSLLVNQEYPNAAYDLKTLTCGICRNYSNCQRVFFGFVYSYFRAYVPAHLPIERKIVIKIQTNRNRIFHSMRNQGENEPH